ncbi:hypothetical protein [Aliiroseovarius sediminis]|uniref:hypothetical protein n=1 Tax=Aliiroseovarius sediminis TaxID=2925839 RepID=UPI001F55B73A|nr:hypothetical protein [Aliiroseovarius sediminis]MCI2395696.1 hypothetical protein [Aliiroseovarius sediminis]
MSLDQTTESIAHFIGLFHLAEEELRLRKEYFEFKIEKKAVVSSEPSFAPVDTKAPYEAGAFSPHSQYNVKPDPVPPVENSGAPVFPAPELPLNDAADDGPVSPVPDANGATVTFIAGSVTILPYVPMPSSAVTITFQSIELHDNDVIGDVEVAGFQPLDGFYSALETAIELAEALQPWSSDGLVADLMTDASAALPFIDMINAVKAPDIDSLNVSIIEDEEIEGIYVNGTLVEEAPELDDQLPAFIKAKRDKLDEDNDADRLSGHDKDDALHDLDNDEFATVINAEHNVSAGANEAHNHVNIHTSWIDAGVIAVSGDVINLNAVSQVNVLSDTDHFEGAVGTDPGATSQAYNIATTQIDSRDIPDGFEITATTTTEFPDHWNVERLEGDVTVTNYVNQHSFVMDADRLDLTFSANSTSIVTGENLTYNLADAGEFGSGYDLIFVGGTMLSFNLINQTNVLMDSDQFSGGGLNDAAISGQDNLLRNDAAIQQEGIDTQVAMADEFNTALEDLKQGAEDLSAAVAQSAYFEGLDQLRVLYIDGDLTQMNIVDQVNYMGDQDQVHMALDAVSSALDDAAVVITTGSNLLTNTATITQTGFDSDVMTGGDYYSDALLYQADLIDTNADPTGVGITALANEAVAFLVDDMIPDPVSDTLDAAGFNNDAHTGGTALDVMQTMTT